MPDPRSQANGNPSGGSPANGSPTDRLLIPGRAPTYMPKGVTHDVEGATPSDMVVRELAQILMKDLAEANYSCDIVIHVQPSNSEFLNPHDHRVEHVDYKLRLIPLGEVKEHQHGNYRVNGRRLGPAG